MMLPSTYPDTAPVALLHVTAMRCQPRPAPRLCPILHRTSHLARVAVLIELRHRADLDRALEVADSAPARHGLLGRGRPLHTLGDLLENPRLDERASPRHRSVRPGPRQPVAAFVVGQNVSVAHHRYPPLALDLPDEVPVRGARVPLLFGSPVNDHRGGARVFHRLGELARRRLRNWSSPTP